MKKIMFDDRFGLTKAVLDGTKTMTRRMVGSHMTDGDIAACMKGYMDVAHNLAPYKIGETVAIAQSYKDAGYNVEWVVYNIPPNPRSKVTDPMSIRYPSWKNKMFVRADHMPHRIQITDIKVERLRDISDMDSRKEGVIPVTWRQYLKQDWDDLSPQKYIDHNVWTLPIFKEGILDPWAESHPDEFMADHPSTAFNVLIRKMMGVKKWESNPYVFAYSFKLIK